MFDLSVLFSANREVAVLKKNQKWTAYIYILPMFLFFLIFLVYPLLNTVKLSLYEWNGIDPEMVFVGLQNYKEMFHDDVFYKAFTNFAIYAALVIIMEIVIGFSLAYLMRRKNFLFNIYKYIKKKEFYLMIEKKNKRPAINLKPLSSNILYINYPLSSYGT